MGARDSDLDRITRRIGGRDAVTQASNAARQFGEAQWLGKDELARLCVVIEELVSNLYDHGGVAAGDEIELTLSSEADGIGVVLVDRGVTFDPWQAPMPEETPERGGGAGIGIVRAWAKLVDYRVTDEGNRLELLLPLRW